MTDPDLAALLDAATPRPWAWATDEGAPVYVQLYATDEAVDEYEADVLSSDERGVLVSDADAALIVAAVNALPRLLEIERAASEWMDADWAELQGLSSPPGAADLNLLGLRVTSAKRAMTASLSPQEPTP